MPAAVSVLDPDGPFACLGASAGTDGLAMPVAPSAHAMFGPRGTCLMSPNGPLWVSDTGHYRLLGWATLPEADDTPADWVIGQPDFLREGRSGKSDPGTAMLNVPTGITSLGEGMSVADAWNHRVLIWHNRPRDSHAPADLVLGQTDFSSVDGNRGAAAAAESLFWPYGVHWDGTHLWVADSGNRRVLMWNGEPGAHAQPADLVPGQRHFTTRDEIGGGRPSRSSMRWPHGVAIWRGRLCIADAGTNRIMIWHTQPTRNNQPCDHQLGQTDKRLAYRNKSLYWESAATLHMSYGVIATGDWLLAADTANSRVLAWHDSDLTVPGAASALTGQPDFHAKGDNRWALPQRDSLCRPYGIGCAGDVAVIADSGNNRVLLWRLSRDLRS
jgi:hypothetical protein